MKARLLLLLVPAALVVLVLAAAPREKCPLAPDSANMILYDRPLSELNEGATPWDLPVLACRCFEDKAVEGGVLGSWQCDAGPGKEATRFQAVVPAGFPDGEVATFISNATQIVGPIVVGRPEN